MVTRLKDSNDDYITIQEGESCNLKGTLKDTGGDTISSPATLTLTLYDESTGVIVNSRNEQNVLNLNGGSVTSGNYVIELDSSDTQIVGSLTEGERQVRVARLSFTWNDGDGIRTGIEEFSFPIQRLKSTVGVGSGSQEVVITITDADGDPVPEARVYIASDEAGTDVVAGAVMTDKDGATPTLNLDAGTYYRFAEKNGFTFSNPEKITVS